MYQPYDPFAYQAYNDPKPDHYASAAAPSGMPQPSRPAAFQRPDATPGHQGYGAPPSYPPAKPPSHEDQSAAHSNLKHSTQYPPSAPSYPPAANPPKQEKRKKEEEKVSYQSVPKRDAKKDTSAVEEGKRVIKQLKEEKASLLAQLSASKNSTDKIVREKDTLMEKLRRDADASRSQASVSQKEAVAAVEREWVQRLSSKEQANLQLLASVRRESEANVQRLSAKEQQTQQLLAQARKNAEVSAQGWSVKEQEYERRLDETRKYADTCEQKISLKEQETQQLLAQVRRDAEASAQRMSATELETQQLLVQLRRDVEATAAKLSLKEQENRDLVDQTENDAATMTQLKREWAARLSKAEQDYSLLLVSFTKHQSDAEAGRTSLLETNAGHEERVTKLRDEAKRHEAEIVKLKEEAENQEAELVKLREKTNKLLEDIDQAVEEKDNTLLSVKKMDGKTLELEERVRQLKGESAEFVADINAMNLEKKKLLRKIAAVEKELDESRNLCEKRRLRIEELDNEQLPTLNSQIELMSMLDEETKGKVAELEDRLAKVTKMLDGARDARDSLELQLDEVEKREMEHTRRLAGENRAVAGDLERAKLQLESHRRDHAKNFTTFESEKSSLVQNLEQVERAKKEALDRISVLEKSLKDVTEKKEEVEYELGIREDALEGEIREGDEARAEFKLRIEELEEQISKLSSSKTTNEAQVAQAEAEQVESEAMIKALNEKYKIDTHSLRSNIEKLEEQLSTLTLAQVAQAEAKTVEAEGTLKALNAEIEKYKMDTLTLMSKLKTLEAQVAESESKKTEIEVLMQAMVKASNDEMEDYKLDAETLRSNLGKLEAEVSALSTAKSSLEARVADSEARRTDAERMLHSTEGMLKAVKEDLEKHKMNSEIAAKGDLQLSGVKSLLEGKVADLERRNGELEAQISQLEIKVKALEEEKAEVLTKLGSLDSVIIQHEDTINQTEFELLNKRRIERQVEVLRIDLNERTEDLRALEAEIGNLTRQLQDANEQVDLLESERTEWEARNVAFLEDMKAAALKADSELSAKETEYQTLNDSFSAINQKYLEIVAERDELTQTIRSLRK